MAEQEDFNRSIIQSWILMIYCSCIGCKKKVEKVLRNIDGVYTVSIDAAEQKVTVTGNVAFSDALSKKLLASGKGAELWPVAQNNYQKEAKTRKQPEHAAVAQNKHQKEAKTQKQPEHAAVAQGEKESKKPKTTKQPEEQKSDRHGGAAVAQGEKESKKPKTTKQLEEQKSDRHGGVHTEFDAAKQKVTVTGNAASADVLLEKLWTVAPNEHQKEAKTQKQPEHAAMAQNKHEKEAKTQKQPEHAVVAQSEKENKKLKTQKQPEHADVAQNEKENKPKTTKQPEEQKSDRHRDNGQVEKDALFTERPVVFTMKELEAATNNFHDDNKLGKGACGSVYLGATDDGKQMAVKQLLSTSEQGRKEFLNEKLLAKIQHRNIVNLLGCCKEGSQMFVVYEYLPHGSLDKFLSDAEKRKDLDWQKRYNIILGIARGLLYLHEDSQLRIVHRDIKASNILLDEKLNPKIADFGTAKVFPEDETHVSTRVVGTRGYIAPEYVMGEQLSVNVDVYSFGILLLELVTGKKISSEMGLLGRVWSSYKRGKIERTIDKAITETYDKEKASRCIHVGFLCTQADPSRRPTMSGVTAMLSTSVTLPVPTNPPGYTARRTKVNPLMNPLEGTMSQL